jgi:transcriptional regulator with XRE-family HTH domain
MLRDGSDLRRLRRAASLTQADLAYLSGLPAGRIAAIEGGAQLRTPERGALEAVLREEFTKIVDQCNELLSEARSETAGPPGSHVTTV